MDGLRYHMDPKFVSTSEINFSALITEIIIHTYNCVGFSIIYVNLWNAYSSADFWRWERTICTSYELRSWSLIDDGLLCFVFVAPVFNLLEPSSQMSPHDWTNSRPLIACVQYLPHSYTGVQFLPRVTLVRIQIYVYYQRSLSYFSRASQRSVRA